MARSKQTAVVDTDGARASETLRFQALVSFADRVRSLADAQGLTPQQWMLNACLEKAERQSSGAAQAA